MMRLALLFGLLVLGTALADDAAKESASNPAQNRGNKSERRLASASALAELLGKDITIPSKGKKIFDATLDYSGAERVSIAVEAPSTVSIANAKFKILVWWSLPAAEWYVLQDVITGEQFYFDNQGGGNVPVYGPQLRVEIRNDNDAAVTLHQLTAYAVAR